MHQVQLPSSSEASIGSMPSSANAEFALSAMLDCNSSMMNAQYAECAPR
jgi:hypothetical protein